MAKAASKRLKVFYAQFGFHDSVVAAPSQAAALRAWGTHQNLFADGQARIASDDAAITAALAHPETPLRRAVGSNDPFELVPTSLPVVPPGPRKQSRAKPTPPVKPNPRPEPAVDRSALDRAEATLSDLEHGHRDEEAAFARRREEFEADAELARKNYTVDRKSASDAVARALAAFRKAGGKR